ncbi:hypothetical protein THASP1DRAFT_24341 [Thamnocephalis sphaerospora]|uniref:Uncharacterized protein n=1 Tax=Thamnocephalis sphaerospora TaxID=78915 RepID=A0A4P9XNG4_9FUNG|nr:hypothetical protein THASP1DRAFT_24341 [Thamnocephalis sphaerospora]|eukprot:RKP07517.1 hypothetical protein THASP1DRAFT_24341 [Thamnocephalis sphaerospora]
MAYDVPNEYCFLSMTRSGKPTPERPLAVLVTGTSTGIGRGIALTLAQQGYTVIAGVRQTAHGAALVHDFKKNDASMSQGTVVRSGGQICPVILDLASEATIAEGWERVNAQLQALDAPLVGLVNNAGNATLRVAEWLSVSDWQTALWTNFLGAVELTRLALPQLRASHGRLVNIGSIAAWMTPPCYASYSASKAAVGAWSRALRSELLPFGVAVAVVEPGVIVTPGPARSLKEMMDHHHQRQQEIQENATPGDPHAVYSYTTESVRAMFDFGADGGVSVGHVVDMVEHALQSPTPRSKYYVGLDARFLAASFTILGEPVLDWLALQFLKVLSL